MAEGAGYHGSRLAPPPAAQQAGCPNKQPNLDMTYPYVCRLYLRELCLLHNLAETGAYYYYSAVGRAAAGGGRRVAKPARLCLQELCLLHSLAEAAAYYYYYSAVGRAAGGGGRQVAKPARASDRHSVTRLPPATKP
uniref:Uncharacterized protein n=1 Tax=Heterosigma akashiwo TaxID=2829 RepID=A0A7S3Y049_HETAK